MGNNIHIIRTDDDPIYVDHYDADARREIRDTQKNKRIHKEEKLQDIIRKIDTSRGFRR